MAQEVRKISANAICSTFRPWPNDSTFLSIFSSTFHLKVEGWLNVVEHMWPNDSTFQLLIFPHRISTKNIAITNILPPIETLLRMLSLDFLDKVAKQLDFHSTTALLLDFFDKDQTLLNITRLTRQGGRTARFFVE